MKQDKWTQQLHDKLADHEVIAPEGLWDEVEAVLKGQKTSTPCTRFMMLRRWSVAASLLVLLTIGGYWFYHRQGANFEERGTKQWKPIVTSETPAVDEQIAVFPQHSPLRSATCYQKRTTIEKKSEQATVFPQVSDSVDSEQEERVKEQENSLVASEVSDTSLVPSPHRSTQSPSPNSADLTDAHHSPINPPSSKAPLSLTLYAMNGFGTQMGNNGVKMSDMMADWYNHTASRSQSVIYLANYEERQKHYQPVSFGLTVGFPLTYRLSLSTGIVFTKVRSDFMYIEPNNQRVEEQSLYYLGIPLNLHYQLWTYKRLRVYASASGQADWNIKANLQTKGVDLSMDKDRIQWSVGASLGVQYDLIPQVGFYAEPGMKYYFDNGSQVQNFFKDKPWNFNLQIGVRLNTNISLRKMQDF